MNGGFTGNRKIPFLGFATFSCNSQLTPKLFFMKVLLVSLFLLKGAVCTSPQVYICDSPNSIRYHLRADCKGLRNCSHRIIQVSLEEANKRKLTLCKLEQ